MTSKNIVSKMQTSLMENNNDKSQMNRNKSIAVDKKLENGRGTQKYHKSNGHHNKNTTNSTKMQQATINFQNEINHKTKNDTDEALKSNQWAYGIVNTREPDSSGKEDPSTTRYPWQGQPKPVKGSYPRNFAYHRVTGNPLYHANVNNNPKAYIAVSVIAPKPINDRPTDDELILENELRELKPWTHNQNLKNMASIRSRWVIQSNEAKPSYAP